MNFTKGNKYSRNDVFRMYFNKELPNKGTGNWTTGYVRPDNTNDLIVFMNIGVPGTTGHDFPNNYEESNNTIIWYGKPGSHSEQPTFKMLKDNQLTGHFFARWHDKDNFKYLGVGKNYVYKDNFRFKNNEGKVTDCIEINLTCSNHNAGIEKVPSKKIYDNNSVIFNRRTTMKTELEMQKEFVEKSELQDQVNFVKEQEESGKGIPGIVLVDAFLKGIRDLGYKNTPYALNELNDNSIQAGARNIHYELIGASNKISELVVYDDGHGMVKGMLPIAVAWGGTHRQGSTRGFGKYGYGLPSASLSMAKKYTLYSKVKGDDWHKIVFDVTKLYEEENVSLDKIKSEVERCELPEFIKGFTGENFNVKELESGTIIHYEEMDRINPTRISNLVDKLNEDFGQTYFKLLYGTNIFINNKKVEPVDVLFATPGCRGFEADNNNIKVSKIDESTYIEKTATVKLDNNEFYDIGIRMAKLDPLFFHTIGEDEKERNIEKLFINGKISKVADTKSYRWKIGQQNTGLVFRRKGRRMDNLTSKAALRGFYNMQNNDNYCKVEINFPAELDPQFEVTTSKQQIIPSSKILKTLEKANVFTTMAKWKNEYEKERVVLKGKRQDHEKENPVNNRDSEAEINTGIAELNEGKLSATPAHQERKDKAEERKSKKIEEIAAKEEITMEQAKQNYEDVYKDRPNKFSLEKLGKFNPIFKIDEHGDTVELILNVDHPFYKIFYMGKGTSLESRSHWQHYFLAFANLQVEYPEDNQDFIEALISRFSEKIASSAKVMFQNDPEKGEFDEEDVIELKDDFPESFQETTKG